MIVFITPYLFALFASFKPLGDILTQSPARPPTSPDLANFKQIFTQDDFGEYLANTLLVTVILTAGQVTFSMMGAYAFARMEFPGRNTLFWVYLATLMVPNVVTLVPLYVMVSPRPACSTPTGRSSCPTRCGVPQVVFLMRQNFMTDPEGGAGGGPAGRLFGGAASCGGSWYRSPSPIIITATLLAFRVRLEQLPVAADRDQLELAQRGCRWGTANLNSNFADQWNLVLAASLVALIPMVILFGDLPEAHRPVHLPDRESTGEGARTLAGRRERRGRAGPAGGARRPGGA